MSVRLYLGIQRPMRMRQIVICGLPRSTIFFHVSSYTARFSKKNIIERKSVFWFCLQLLLETFFFLRRKETDMLKNVYFSSRKVTGNLVGF